MVCLDKRLAGPDMYSVTSKKQLTEDGGSGLGNMLRKPMSKHHFPAPGPPPSVEKIQDTCPTSADHNSASYLLNTDSNIKGKNIIINIDMTGE